MEERIVGAADAAKRIEAHQKDLTEMIAKLIELRKAKFSGRFVLVYENGRIVQSGFPKKDERGQK